MEHTGRSVRLVIVALSGPLGLEPRKMRKRGMDDSAYSQAVTRLQASTTAAAGPAGQSTQA